MALFPVLVLFIILAFSLEKNTIGTTNTVERNQQLAMRGLFACYIVFSHMYRNSDVFDNSMASTFLSVVSPSLLCIFFYYSGYGVMYKYIKNGVTSFRECLSTWICKLIIPATLAFVAKMVLDTITNSHVQLSPIVVINELGGWFLKTLIILQLIFWIISNIIKREEYFVFALFCAIAIAVAVMRLIGLQSYYYIDCFAFVFGAASCIYSKQWFKLVSNRVIIASCGIFTILMGGGYTYSVTKWSSSIENGNWIDSRIYQ